MTPLDIMEALRDVPEDLIDISECRTDKKDEKRVPVQKVIALDWPKAHFREEQVQCKAEDPSRKRNGSAIMSYLMTAGCTAACIAGFALMIRLFTEPVYPEQEISIPSETQNAAVTEITDLTTERTAAVTASQTNTETAAVNTATTAAVLQTDRTSATTAGLASGATVHISGTGSRAVSGTAGRTETASAGRRRTGTTTTRATGTTRRMTTTTSRITGITTGTTAILTETSAATSETARSVTTTETTAETAPPVPPILLQYCQTLTDGRPLWEAYRELSYHDGLDYTIRTGTDEDPFARTPNLTPFPLTGLYVEIGCAQGAPGETVTVPVYIAGAPDLASATIFIDPPEGLTASSITSKLTEDFNLHIDTIEDQWFAYGENGTVSGYYPKGSFFMALISGYEIVEYPSDGYVIAYYSYRIPEDAQPGIIYPVCLNPAKTEFTAILNTDDDSTGRTHEYKDYQYTLLSGVVVVA